MSRSAEGGLTLCFQAHSHRRLRVSIHHRTGWESALGSQQRIDRSAGRGPGAGTVARGQRGAAHADTRERSVRVRQSPSHTIQATLAWKSEQRFLCLRLRLTILSSLYPHVLADTAVSFHERQLVLALTAATVAIDSIGGWALAGMASCSFAPAASARSVPVRCCPSSCRCPCRSLGTSPPLSLHLCSALTLSRVRRRLRWCAFLRILCMRPLRCLVRLFLTRNDTTRQEHAEGTKHDAHHTAPHASPSDSLPEVLSHPLPSGSHCPFLMLATIEIQLCMIALPCADLLRFARSCRRTAAAARSSFPWMSLVTLVDANVTSSPPRTGFLSFTPVALSWSTRRSKWRKALPESKGPLLVENGRRAGELISRLDSMHSGAAIPRPLHRLELHCHGRPFFDWHYWVLDRVLVHPAVKSVRVLKLTKAAWRKGDEALMLALQSLPMLHSLSVAPGTDYPFFTFHGNGLRDVGCYIDKKPGSGAAWAGLSSLPSLTALNCADSGFDLQRSRLPHIFACSHLRRLTLVWPSLYGANSARFFSAPSMRQLEVLTLDNFDASRNPNSSDFIHLDDRTVACTFDAAWSCMHRLHSLHLRHVSAVDCVLSSLSSAPALTLLTIYPAINPTFIHQKNSKLPTPTVLASLIESAPLSLRVVLQLPRMNHSRFVPLTVASYESDVMNRCGRGFSIDLVGGPHLR